MCASGSYSESQTTGSGSTTSLVLPHQSEVQTEPQHGELLPGIVSLLPAVEVPPAEAGGGGACCQNNPLPARGGASATGSAAAAGYIGSGLRRLLPRQPPPCSGLHRGGGGPSAAGRQSRATIPVVELQGVKSKIPFPPIPSQPT